MASISDLKENYLEKATLKVAYADNLFLPLSLRLLSTALPFFVLILFLKPCSFFLCLLLG